MPSRPLVLLDPRQGDVGYARAAPVEDALRSIPREFDTRPVSMNLHHPTATDGPQKSAASTERAIATAAKQGPSIPAQLGRALGLGRVEEVVAIVNELPPPMLRDAKYRTPILKALDPLDPIEWNAPLGANWLAFNRRSRRGFTRRRCRQVRCLPTLDESLPPCRR
jgi:hypothetical protein